MQDARTRAALLIVCLVCLLGSGFVLLAGHRAVPSPVTISPPPPDPAAPPPSVASATGSPHSPPKPASRVYVDVSGAVRRPSLYVLPPGSRVMQAILVAGGPTGEADTDSVNLAEKLTDGEKVFVPKRTAPPPSVSAVSPSPLSLPVKAGKGASGGKSSKVSADAGEQIALNTASAEQLERLPGIGPGLAGRILAYRQQAGRFEKIEDLMEVTGLGPKKFAKIAPFVKLD